MVVDDAQWVDRASSRALAYVLRHLRAGRVLVVVACRDISDPWLPEGLRRSLTGDSTLRLTLEGLTPGDLAALLSWPEAEVKPGAVPERGGAAWAGAGHSLDRPHSQALLRDGHDRAVPGADLSLRSRPSERLGAGAVRRLWEHTLGNPLHARELLGTLAHGVLDDPGARLPAPGTYRRGFERRLRACGPDTARLVAACAVLGGPTPLHVAATVAAPVSVGGVGCGGVPLEAFEEAEAAGLLREVGGRLVDFPEPLARAAAYDGIGPAARARLHLAAAGVADDTGAALRHRAAAAFGPDGELAEELAGFAVKAAQHGLWREAAAHLDRAAGLTEPAGRRDELRTAVLEHVLIGGDVLHAARLAAARNTDPRPARRYVLGRLALAAGRFEAAYELLSEAWRHAEPGHAADVAEQLAWLHLVTGDPVEAAAWARQVIDQPIQSPAARPPRHPGPDQGPDLRRVVRGRLGIGRRAGRCGGVAPAGSRGCGRERAQAGGGRGRDLGAASAAGRWIAGRRRSRDGAVGRGGGRGRGGSGRGDGARPALVAAPAGGGLCGPPGGQGRARTGARARQVRRHDRPRDAARTGRAAGRARPGLARRRPAPGGGVR
ncbi:hypothetical protein [Nonomuraea salmonea]|uniref:hypothetical protein n=1 Tax=Nonomuraea salmonea TaxID=46181 RepID=UPI002FE79953